MFGGCDAVNVFMILSDETFRPLILLVFSPITGNVSHDSFFFLVTDGLTRT